MTRYLTAEQVGRINLRYGGGGLTPTNSAGVEGAVARPAGAFGGVEAFPTLWSKAGALLDGLSSTQYFVDGNKRTAWMATVAFLRANGIRLPSVDDIEAEAFVLAVATIHDFGPEKAAEWFKSVFDRRRRVAVTDPRIEYFTLAKDAYSHVDPLGSSTSMIDASALHLHTIMASSLPAPHLISAVFRIQWDREDAQTEHQMDFAVRQQKRVVVPMRRDEFWTWPLDVPVPGGFAHHDSGLIPVIVTQHLPMSLVQEGTCEVVLSIDGLEAASHPLRVLEQDMDPSGIVVPPVFDLG